jgi:2',3'-cyclic-nucleotide 2'-phosphodiesterase/3'-nucleotidase
MPSVTAKLRILATTDVHMNLSGFDYASDVQGPSWGLAGISTLISKARTQADQEGRSSILVDNGDFLQGTPLADWQSTRKVTSDHPLIATFNAMGYDAIGLGNHDLDYHGDYLSKIIKALNAPVISTNLELEGMRGLEKNTVLTRMVETSQGAKPLKIGIISALPVETEVWNRMDLPSGSTVKDPLPALGKAADLLRRQGADLIIALAHMGLRETGAANTTGENGARLLGKMSGIDVVIAGHTHQRFAQTDQTGQIPATSCPTVMPGSAAADLGFVDLDLVQGDDSRWQISHHQSQLWPQTKTLRPDPEIMTKSKAAHQATRVYLAEEVGQTKYDLYSYFALLRPSTTMGLSARAKAMEVAHALLGRPESSLPLLATATARAVGGMQDPLNYIHIPKGPVFRRNLTRFAPSGNRICAVRVTGADLRKWLEQSARIYNHLLPSHPHQLLLDDNQPSFIFDTIYGLDYQIDPSQPLGRRITSLMFDQTPIDPNQPFILATNHFRAAGGGGYDQIHLPEPLFYSTRSPTDLIRQALLSDDLAGWMSATPWRLACEKPVQAEFECSPNAARYIEDIRALSPKNLGRTDTGFDRIQITL